MNKIYIALLLTLLSLIVVLLFMRREWIVVNELPETALIEAVVTAYSKAETCPDEECITSSGKVAVQGIVACPRAIKLGTRVEIESKEYECGDRTAKWIEEKYPNTFDIFMGDDFEAYNKAVQFGRQE